MEGKKFEIHPRKSFTIEGLADETPISAILPIEESGLEFWSKEDLKNYVEAPLLAACELLFDKGIRTVFSSANQKDIPNGHAYITLDYELLSPANRQIATEIGAEGIIHGPVQKKGIYLEIPLTVQSTLGEVKAKALALAGLFENQNRP